MHGLRASLAESRSLALGLLERPFEGDVVICPPATLIAEMARDLSGSSIRVGAQNCHDNVAGAHTGEISALMLADAGASYVILGHSERRVMKGESNANVAAKVDAAIAAGLRPVICVGDTAAERAAGETFVAVNDRMLGSLPPSLRGASFAMVYEPHWPVASDRPPEIAEVEGVRLMMRDLLIRRFGASGERVPILYGGHVCPATAPSIFGQTDLDGALIGGASLRAADMLQIIRAFERGLLGSPRRRTLCRS